VNPQGLQNGKDPFTFQGLNAGGAEGAFGYTIPNLMIDHAMRNTHIPPHFWRGVNNNQNALYLECFMDELAHAAGQDPLAFRRKLMANHPKHLGVLNAVAERAGWDKPAPKGVFRGLSQHMGYGSYVAACAEVSVSGKGEVKIHRIIAATNPGNAVNPAQIERQIAGSFVYGLSALFYGECTVKDGDKVKVHKIVAATDCGYAVNPAQIERQIAGSFVYGLSALFNQECTLKDGRMEQENFHSYDSMRIAQMPKVESIIMPSGGFWGGVGEPTICVAAPAVLNALFLATGKRIRSFPLKNHGFQLV
jgi:isoquinoline 1-oxidoreductase beta subunit